jgi:hypothetical protein
LKFTFRFDLYGCETWSITLREKSRLRVFENRVLRRISGPEKDEVTGEWRRLENYEEEQRTGAWCGNRRERDHLEDPDADGRMILKWII